MADKKTAPDWDKAERLYRAGQMSNVLIAKEIGVSEGAVRKKAKELGWEKDLTEQVKKAVRVKLVRAQVRAADPEGAARTDREIAEQAAELEVAVRRDHQKITGRGRRMIDMLLSELEQTTIHIDAIEDAIDDETAGDKTGERRAMMQRAVALPSRAGVLDKLASATAKFVAAEREAWGMNDKDSDKDELDSLTEEQLLARLHALEARYKEVMG